MHGVQALPLHRPADTPGLRPGIHGRRAQNAEIQCVGTIGGIEDVAPEGLQRKAIDGIGPGDRRVGDVVSRLQR